MEAWSFCSSQYIQNMLLNIEKHLKSKWEALKKRATSYILPGYRPEINVTGKQTSDDEKYYQSLKGILLWIVELGR